MNQYQDPFEQTTESVTKSSGFSSFSSLLSSNENPITKHSRSLSMPSIHMTTYSSFDSENVSLESQSELNKIKQRSELSTEKQINFTSNHSNNLTSSLEINDMYYEKKSNPRQRFHSTDLLENNQIDERIKHSQRSMDNILLEQKSKSGIETRIDLKNSTLLSNSSPKMLRLDGLVIYIKYI
jgi:hypothetical protein